jgi:hypothetical protein
VGKSSTVTAGLVPALQNRAIGDQIACTSRPASLYRLGARIRQIFAKCSYCCNSKESSYCIRNHPVTQLALYILQQLRENADNHLITVLIFDQFEEFFFGYTDGQPKTRI